MNVKQWQRMMGIPESGRFDKDTHDATVKWQREWNQAHPDDLLRTDGVVDERTWTAGIRSHIVRNQVLQ